jgi:AsmA-like C-terminal region/AsmA family
MPRQRLLWWLIGPVICVALASWSFSLALQGGWLRRSLSARLAATFGRPVEVAHFGFTILGGPEFEADSVTVGEDARFGQEYFLRADRLNARLRWGALLQGRMEFDRLSLSHPSLNLVRSADGTWNIEAWLPAPSTQASVQLPRSPAEIPAHASRIDISGGRINFKKGIEKLPFAFVDVNGTVNLHAAGRWSLDLQARPARAAVILQKSGTLRLRGTIGGTSTRLQPADLSLSWTDASVADAARLARGTDYGLRGLLDADFAARIIPGGDHTSSPWEIEGGFRLQAIHRWDLVARPDNPAVNVQLVASWRPAEARLEVEHWLMEAPSSNLKGDASIDWSRGFDPQVRLLHSAIGFPDLVTWTHAFFPGRAEDLNIDGTAEVEAKLVSWPLRIEDLSIASTGASVRSVSNLAEIRVGPIQGFWSRSSLVLAPVAMRLLSSSPNRAPRGIRSETVSDGLFHIDGTLGPIRAGGVVRDWPYKLTFAGQTTRLEHFRSAVAALGWQLQSNWIAEGPASLQLLCTGTLRPGTSLVHGQLDLRDLRLTNSTLNEPILVSTASVEFAPGQRIIQIAGAQALGARWKGRLERRAANADWTFDLSASRLELEKLGRELGQSQQGLLYRILPFAGSFGLGAQTESAIAGVNAQGRLHIDELALGGLLLQSLDATADLHHGALNLRRAQADFYGGRLSGEFSAQLGTEPRYTFQGQLDRTDLSALAALTLIKNGFEGLGSGEVELAAHGIGRQALLASLEGQGFLQVQNASIDLLNSPLSLADSSFRELADSRFRSSTVSFRVQDGNIRVNPWLLSGRQRQMEIIGDIDFSRRLDLQVRSIAQSERFGPLSDPPPADEVWLIGGTVDDPQIIREERVAAGSRAITHAGRH